jgi:hypothetical protein
MQTRCLRRLLTKGAHSTQPIAEHVVPVVFTVPYRHLRRFRIGEKESKLENGEAAGSLKSLDVNGITSAQILPLIRILKVFSAREHPRWKETVTLHVFFCRPLHLSNCRWKRL